MKDALLKYETLDRKQIDDLMNRRPVGEPAGWNDKNDNSSSNDSSTVEKPDAEQQPTDTPNADAEVADKQADA
ncbi:cell division protease FtsH-like protein [Actinobacillus equuli]|nr:cell division protease FtsH-like protein [Actinobacillus equuli]